MPRPAQIAPGFDLCDLPAIDLGQQPVALFTYRNALSVQLQIVGLQLLHELEHSFAVLAGGLVAVWRVVHFQTRSIARIRVSKSSSRLSWRSFVLLCSIITVSVISMR